MSDEVRRDKLGRWEKGQSGNPAGKPKGARSLSVDLHRVLRELATGDELQAMFDALDIPAGLQIMIENSQDRQEAFARALVFRALTGHWNALEEIFGRLDPKPKAIELSGRDGGPIQSAGVVLSGAAPEDAQAAYLALARGELDGGDEGE